MNLDKINARNWGLLMNAVSENRVVPIIGENLIYVVTNDGRYDVRTYLLKCLSERYGEGYAFKDYTYADDIIQEFNKRTKSAGSTTDIYYEIYELLNNVTIEIPKFVVDFFKLCKFPLILTTSFVKGIDKALGSSINNIKVYNKKSNSDISKYEIKSDSATLYYLFGRMSMTKRSFKVTDDDLLDYLHCWHNSDTRPNNLGEYLSDKFLLVLGCNYPNWLFRFFWHSIKNFNIIPTSSDMQGVVTVSRENAEADEDLINFLSRVQTSVYRNAEDFINEFTERFEPEDFGEITSEDSNRENTKSNANQAYDIFISYASEDYEIAEQLANRLKDAGASVWFDKKTLEPGEHYEKSISNIIQECKRFIPILSEHTLQKGRRFFKKEWTLAIEESGFRLDEPYISPIVIDHINPQNESAIPSVFKKDSHIITLHDSDFDLQIKKLIRSFR